MFVNSFIVSHLRSIHW